MKIWKFIPVLLLLGCANNPVQNSQTNNPKVEVSLLFEHDGCKVYRFFDAGEYIYYVNCGNSVQTTWYVPEGKVMVPKTVPTN